MAPAREGRGVAAAAVATAVRLARQPALPGDSTGPALAAVARGACAANETHSTK